MASIVLLLIGSLILTPKSCSSKPISQQKPLDSDHIEFALNLEYLEAEFFLYGSSGHGLDVVAPKAIKSAVKGFPRPLLDLSKSSFAKVMDSAFGRPLVPPFDPYANDINFLLASYVIPYVGLTGYVGANPLLQNATSRRLVGGLLGVESGQDAVIRTLLYQADNQKLLVKPYDVSVAEFTNRISTLRNKLGHGGLKDEGLVVSKKQGSEGSVSGNILAGDKYSLSYPRTPQEILRIVYGSGNESVPGGFYPHGGKGHIATSYLKS
uniref:Desiccation-related protein PCC13-62-like n=1 Tax=Cicer arietinum TaxID=3827 RepID=A0A3Q7Y2R9_CICAR|nr:desiccation-related protein PCC13-62-like [Cicer arietinum]